MFTTGTILQMLAVASVGSAAGHHAPLNVQLSPFNGTTITAVITNTGERAYNLLHRNSILDLEPSRKLRLSSHAHGNAHFHGLQKHQCGHAGHETPSANDFTTIAAGQSLYRDIDVAEMYDLDTDLYDVFAEGSIPYADDGSLWLSGHAVPFSSNILELPVTSSQVVDQAHMKQKRTTIQSDCSSEQNSVITTANQGCVDLANAAAEAATSGSDFILEKYFKDSSDSARSKIAKVFTDVAKECSETPGGTSESFCTDPYSYCSGNLIAYTYWTTGGGYGYEPERNVYYCPRYFEMMPQDSNACHSQSQASNVLHEMTHALAETDDHAYGFDDCMALSAEQAIANADTYALFATDVEQGCAEGGNKGSDGGSYGPPQTYTPEGSSDNGWQGESSNNGGEEQSSNNGGETVEIVTTTIQAPAPAQTSAASAEPDNAPADEETPAEAPQQQEGSGDPSSQPEPSGGSTYTWDDLMQWFRNYMKQNGGKSEGGQWQGRGGQSRGGQWQHGGQSTGGRWQARGRWSEHVVVESS